MAVTNNTPRTESLALAEEADVSGERWSLIDGSDEMPGVVPAEE